METSLLSIIKYKASGEYVGSCSFIISTNSWTVSAEAFFEWANIVELNLLEISFFLLVL